MVPNGPNIFRMINIISNGSVSVAMIACSNIIILMNIIDQIRGIVIVLDCFTICFSRVCQEVPRDNAAAWNRKSDEITNPKIIPTSTPFKPIICPMIKPKQVIRPVRITSVMNSDAEWRKATSRKYAADIMALNSQASPRVTKMSAKSAVSGLAISVLKNSHFSNGAKAKSKANIAIEPLIIRLEMVQYSSAKEVI